MKSLGRLVFLLVLAVVMMFGPVVQVEAADGEAVANDLSGWLAAVGYGALILGVIAVTIVGLSSLQGIREWAKVQLLKADRSRALQAVGNSVPGKAINAGLKELLLQVDEPNDPLIKRLEATKVLRQLHQWGVIEGDDFSRIAAALLADGIRLTNGVPDVEFDLLNYDSTTFGADGNGTKAIERMFEAPTASPLSQEAAG